MARRHPTQGRGRSARGSKLVREKRAGLGAEFLAEIGITFELLARDPEVRPDYYRGFRRVITRRFPYKIFYRLEGNQVIVFRVLHAHRDHPRLLAGEN